MNNNINMETNNNENENALCQAIDKYLISESYDHIRFHKPLDKGIILNPSAVHKEEEELKRKQEKQKVLEIGNALLEEVTSTHVISNSCKVLQKIKENKVCK